MANQHPTLHTTKRIVRAILIGLALVILVVSLDQSATQLSNQLGTVVKDAIALLPSLVLTAWRASQPSAEHPFSLCALQMLLSLPLLQTVAKAA